ncbi:VanZ family protein [Marinobacter orientalis]|uniref:VanZ family protein n=1 Tax=Marinobacter orientalis TaxID=1928859 RepID=A0A7Y0RE05_9GAMM|nr:VanZ family protein [Marinobacter orientalis]NMT64499.1 VanZ family protein [Marinobacter orientalis]TGX50544.1 VanZ family protein [Marinobacter orientalis]
MIPYLPADRRARKARICQYLAFAGIVLIAPFFFIGGPQWTDGPLYKSAWNLGHILFFVLLTIAVQPWRIWAGWRLWLFATLAVFLFGLGIELLQYGLSRQMDWHDVLRNLLGLWAVLAVWPRAIRGRFSPPTVWVLRIIVAGLLIAEVGDIARIGIRQYQVSQLLPALYDFSREDPAPFWNGPITATPGNRQNDRQGQLEISLSTNRYSGASLDNFPHDWRGYRHLIVTMYNPQRHSMTLNLRINDVKHDLGDNAYNDRFNIRLELPPGEHSFRLDLDRIRDAPAGRRMDMGAVRRLGLFVSGLTEPKTVYLRDIRLE